MDERDQWRATSEPDVEQAIGFCHVIYLIASGGKTVSEVV